MKKNYSKIIAISSALTIAGCASSSHNNGNPTITLSNCSIQETIPGASSTGAFLTINKSDNAPLALIAAKLPSVTKHVEIHEMVMKNNRMMMNHINKYDLQKGSNVFKKGSYHIMLMGINKKLTAGDHHPMTLVFSDGSEKTCSADVKTVEALTPQGMKHHGMHKGHDMHSHSK